MNPALTFYSSISEEPFARLEAASIGPRYARHGPFRVPAPGMAIESPTLELHDQPCAPEDWRRLLQDLAAWRRLPGTGDFVLHLPDRRAYVFLRSPSLGGALLTGLVRPLSDARQAPAAPLLLRIRHDGGKRLHIDLRPLPSRPEHGTELELVEPAPEEAPPSETTAESPAPSNHSTP